MVSDERVRACTLRSLPPVHPRWGAWPATLQPPSHGSRIHLPQGLLHLKSSSLDCMTGGDVLPKRPTIRSKATKSRATKFSFKTAWQFARLPPQNTSSTCFIFLSMFDSLFIHHYNCTADAAIVICCRNAASNICCSGGSIASGLEQAAPKKG